MWSTVKTSLNVQTMLAADNAAIRTAIAVGEYQEATVVLGGAFGSQSVKCVRVGSQITISALSLLAHASASSASSDVGVIPAAYRAVGLLRSSCSTMVTNIIDVIEIDVDGTLWVRHYDTTVGNSIARTTTLSGPSLSYTTI